MFHSVVARVAPQLETPREKRIGRARPLQPGRHLLPTRAACTGNEEWSVKRRALVLTGTLTAAATALTLPAATESAAAAAEAAAEPVVTQRAFLDFALCASTRAEDRLLGGSAACVTPEPLGRVTIALYGKVAPQTVRNFLTILAAEPKAGGLAGTLIHSIKPGQYIQHCQSKAAPRLQGRLQRPSEGRAAAPFDSQAGRQGSARMGEVEGLQLPSGNADTISAAAFALPHVPGAVSLSLGECDDERSATARPGYSTVEFTIHTGPGPTPSMDGENVVFGRVEAGFDVVQAVARVPTYAPLASARTWNGLAQAIGDDRAKRARESWTKPRQAVVIAACGML